MTPPSSPLKHFRLIGRFDEHRALLEEVQSQPELFEVDASRQQRIRVQRETRSIPVRVKQRRTDFPDQSDRDVLGARWSNWAERLPRLRAFLERIAEDQNALIGRVRVVNLPAGQRVYPHIDRGDYYRQYERHHLVLRSTDGSWLKSGDEEVRMRDGELWWFDNRLVHEAFNDGDHDRLHVIFDLLPRARAHLLNGPVARPVLQNIGLRSTLAPGVHRIQLPGCMPCQLIVPSATKDRTALVAIHGMTRNVEAQVAALVDRAEALGRWVIVPRFSSKTFPHYRLGRCDKQADAMLLQTLRELAVSFGLDLRKIDLAGHSAGAQFAHRFGMLYPNRIRRLILSASGWYTMPDLQREHDFPVGMAGSDLRARLMHSNLRAYLGLSIIVAVGSRDNVADGTTRCEPELDAIQGRNRVERARRYVQAIAEAGASLNQRTDARIEIIRGAGHDFSECARLGLASLMLDHPGRAGARETVTVSDLAQPLPEAQAA